MRRALDLARIGLGKVSPNPMVGCVITHRDRIIGEGWHRAYGEPHAEVNAINSIEDSSILQECTVYVNLEPCSFHGKTPPCTDLLIKSRVRRVVIGSRDVNPKVNGHGIQRLRDHGIEVIEDVLSEEGRELNRRFFVNQVRKRPFIILKWAETSDGFIARQDYSSKWISTPDSRKLVHKWRSEEDAVLVGRNTALYDNPRLDVRDWEGRNPVRVVLDPRDVLPDELFVKDNSTKTFIYTTKARQGKDKPNHIVIEQNKVFLDSVLEDLWDRGMGSIIVEGGAITLQNFIDKELWDEARVFTSKGMEFINGILAPRFDSVPIHTIEIEGDVLNIYRSE